MIIRRNPDGSLVDEPQQSHPALTTRRGMAALSESGRAVPPTGCENDPKTRARFPFCYPKKYRK